MSYTKISSSTRSYEFDASAKKRSLNIPGRFAYLIKVFLSIDF